MAKKGQVFQQYTEDFKLAAVKAYLEGEASYKAVSEKLEIRNCTQLKVWVRKWQHGEAFDIRKAVSKSGKGGTLSPQDNYQVIEELRDHYDVARLLAIAGVPRASYYKWRATRSLRAERQTRDH
ncbi:transposase [Paenibacillus sp. OSY-SE]|uniref:transposase n=1 Tax=Paenibacillus sp. OSY-SE TaxID=1196323 RepID=UPI0003164AF3